jgi:hypothetical protein
MDDAYGDALLQQLSSLIHEGHQLADSNAASKRFASPQAWWKSADGHLLCCNAAGKITLHHNA